MYRDSRSLGECLLSRCEYRGGEVLCLSSRRYTGGDGSLSLGMIGYVWIGSTMHSGRGDGGLDMLVNGWCVDRMPLKATQQS
jgi:hypothetical protein